jgi:hypothetical protein
LFATKAAGKEQQSQNAQPHDRHIQSNLCESRTFSTELERLSREASTRDTRPPCKGEKRIPKRN